MSNDHRDPLRVPLARTRRPPVIRSYEPALNWWWCYPDELFFEVEGAPPSPSHL